MVGTNKSLGQHWLKNRQILDEIAVLAMDSSETCLEIGPGLGTLTSSLLKRFKKVIAVEFDERLSTNLPKSFPGKNLEVVHGDILKYDFSQIKEPYAVAGNIPYYITSPIIEKLLTLKNPPKRIVLLIQKEVAERILDKKETMLSLFVKNRADVTAGSVVQKNEFTPPPKVDSQIIVLAPHAPIASEETFNLISQGFKAPRKKLLHNLAPFYSKEDITNAFKELNINPDARPGDLHLDSWQNLHQKLQKSKP